MAADVGRQMKSERSSKTTSVLITRDFLGGDDGGGGGGSSVDAMELDLDLHVPSGWEKRLDLKSGKVYIQRSNATVSSDHVSSTGKTSSPRMQDLNFPPQGRSNLALSLFEDNTSLELKLVSPSSSSSRYQSVCTLDKVKSALDRAERNSSFSFNKKRSTAPILLASSPHCNKSSSFLTKEIDGIGNDVRSSDQCGLMVAAACPSCLFYVLISKDNPRCPKCNSVIQLSSLMMKKPKIDLNISI